MLIELKVDYLVLQCFDPAAVQSKDLDRPRAHKQVRLGVSINASVRRLREIGLLRPLQKCITPWQLASPKSDSRASLYCPL